MIKLTVGGSSDLELWAELIRLGQLSSDWTLIGARMVELHAAELGQAPLRVSADADALANARARPNAVSGLARILVKQGFELQEPSYMGLGHRFVRGLLEIDVLAPEGLGRTSELARTTIPPRRRSKFPAARKRSTALTWSRSKSAMCMAWCRDRTSLERSFSRPALSTSTMHRRTSAAISRCF